jgi:hypothetical protein
VASRPTASTGARFQTLRYREIWTLVYTLVVLSALVDA